MSLKVANQDITTQLKVFFHAVDGTGHINACIGLAQALAKRGHQITFIQNGSYAGQFAKLGFEEILLKSTTEESNPVKDTAALRLKLGFIGPKSPLEKLREQVNRKSGYTRQVIDKLMLFNSLVEEAIESERPDLFILDSYMVLPAIRLAKIPWVLLFSGNPIMLYQSERLPPFESGYATTSDPESWQEYAELQKLGIAKFCKIRNYIYEQFGIELTEEDKSAKIYIHLSPYLNIYGYPAELDYHDIVQRPSNLAQLDAFCREESNEEVFEIPEALNFQSGDKLIYFSLGSMGSIDVELMKRIVAVFSKTLHKYIVSKGQSGDEFELPFNCWGQNFLPQNAILPLVDLVISHGGNNTICEALAFGKPQIVLPLFSDQPDNAQRMQEKGYGISLEAYNFTDTELIDAINRVLNDKEMSFKAKVAAERMAKAESKEKVVVQLEQIVVKFQEEKQND